MTVSVPATIYNILPPSTLEIHKKFAGNEEKAFCLLTLSFFSFTSSTLTMCPISSSTQLPFSPSNGSLMQYAVFPHLSVNEADEYS